MDGVEEGGAVGGAPSTEVRGSDRPPVPMEKEPEVPVHGEQRPARSQAPSDEGTTQEAQLPCTAQSPVTVQSAPCGSAGTSGSEVNRPWRETGARPKDSSSAVPAEPAVGPPPLEEPWNLVVGNSGGRSSAARQVPDILSGTGYTPVK